MKEKLIIIGGGELARVIIEAASDWEVIGYVDPRPRDETTRRLGVRHLGGDDVLKGSYTDTKIVLGVGCIKVSDARRAIVQSLGFPKERWASIVHPRAVVSPTAKIGHGAVILAGAVVCTGADIGAHAIINIGSAIDHDVSVGYFVHVCPNVALGGGVKIGHGSFIGLGAVVRDHLHIEPFTMIGMGAVVTRTAPAGSLLVGNPATQRTAKVPL